MTCCNEDLHSLFVSISPILSSDDIQTGRQYGLLTRSARGGLRIFLLAMQYGYKTTNRRVCESVITNRKQLHDHTPFGNLCVLCEVAILSHCGGRRCVDHDGSVGQSQSSSRRSQSAAQLGRGRRFTLGRRAFVSMETDQQRTRRLSGQSLSGYAPPHGPACLAKTRRLECGSRPFRRGSAPK